MIFLKQRSHQQITSEWADQSRVLALFLLLAASPGVYGTPIQLNASFHPVLEQKPIVAHVERLDELPDLYSEGEQRLTNIWLPSFFTRLDDMPDYFSLAASFAGSEFRSTLFEWDDMRFLNGSPWLPPGEFPEIGGELRFSAGLPGGIGTLPDFTLPDFLETAGFMTTDWHGHSQPEAFSIQQPASAPPVASKYSRICPQWQHWQKRELYEACAEDTGFTDSGIRSGTSGQGQRFVSGRADGVNLPISGNTFPSSGIGASGSSGDPFFSGGGNTPAGMGGKTGMNDEKSFNAGSGGMGDGTTRGAANGSTGMGSEAGTGTGTGTDRGNGHEGSGPGNPGGSGGFDGTDPERTGTIAEPGSFALFALGFPAFYFTRRRTTT